MSILFAAKSAAASSVTGLAIPEGSSGRNVRSVERVAWAGNSGPSLRTWRQIAHSVFLVVREVHRRPRVDARRYEQVSPSPASQRRATVLSRRARLAEAVVMVTHRQWRSKENAPKRPADHYLYLRSARPYPLCTDWRPLLQFLL